MGVDICLESIWNPFMKKLESEPPPVRRPDQSMEEFIISMYDRYRASGGYFRNGYNAGDVMWASCLSWNIVAEMLDKNHYLPVERARELVEMIEARPLTREHVVARVFGNMGNGHPVTETIARIVEEAKQQATGEAPPPRQPPTQEEVDNGVAFLNTRRDELLAILRKSIELNEPLRCSL
jgi:hypothetical protein